MSTLMNLLKLANNAANGVDNIPEGAVGCEGYGFVFRAREDFPKIISYSSTDLYLLNVSLFDPSKWKNEVQFAGALKTLLPDLKLGGEILLFEVWTVISAPEGFFYMAFFYSGANQLRLSNIEISEDDLEERPDLKDFVNALTPDFDTQHQEELSRALKGALLKVPVSDFSAIFTEWEYFFKIEIKNGKVFIEGPHISEKFDPYDDLIT